jgi:hypothetical protein
MENKLGCTTVLGLRIPIVVLLGASLVAAGCSSKTESSSDTRGLSVEQKQAPPKRLALVIGNARYSSSPLSNPVNDAELIYRTLRDLGFDAKLYTNRNQREMKTAIREFGEALQAAAPNAVGLFYYAGHGVQVNGRNYLIPVGAAINSDADVDIEAVSADAVLEQMRESSNRLNFLILDACRNNPFTRSSRSVSRGLAQMDAPAGVMIAYSTAPGDVAADGSGRNSPYSQALARAMRSSAMPAELMFKEARDEVMHVTADKQTPWEASSLTGENFYFANTARDARVASVQPAPAAPAVEVARETEPPAQRAHAPARPRPSTPAAEQAPEATAGPASTTATRAGRAVAGVLAGFGKGVFDATKEMVKPGARTRSANDCQNSRPGGCSSSGN